MAIRMGTVEAPGTLVFRVERLREQLTAINADLRAAGEIPKLTTVRLNLLYNDDGWRELPALFRRIFRLLPSVTALHVEDAFIIVFRSLVDVEPRGDYVARALGQVERPPQLEELVLRESWLTGDGFERLEGFVGGLSSLDVSGNHLGDVALRQLASWKSAARSLTRLRMDDNELTARGIHTLANDGHFPRLVELGLSKCRLGAASVRRLAEGALESVTDLALGGNPLGDEGARALADAAWSGRLERLELAQCAIGDTGAREIAGSPNLRSLGLLDLRGNDFTDRGRKAIHDRFGTRALTGAFPEAPG